MQSWRYRQEQRQVQLLVVLLHRPLMHPLPLLLADTAVAAAAEVMVAGVVAYAVTPCAARSQHSTSRHSRRGLTLRVALQQTLARSSQSCRRKLRQPLQHLPMLVVV